MNTQPTEHYIKTLEALDAGDLSRLRAWAGKRLDESLNGFDLFSGLWWPLRQISPKAPRREVAWLIAKLFAAKPLVHSPGNTLARQLRRCRPADERLRERFGQRFDDILAAPLDRIETPLRWALGQIAATGGKLDWVKLTDDLSVWHRESVRIEWAKQFLDL